MASQGLHPEGVPEERGHIPPQGGGKQGAVGPEPHARRRR